MSVTCKECGLDFKSERSVHIHLKKHKLSLAEYYEKHFPRLNMATGKPLKFKDKEDYFGRFFDNRPQMNKFLMSGDAKAPAIALELLRRRVEDKELEFAPSHVELELLELPALDIYKHLFGSYWSASQELDIEPLFNRNLTFNLADYEDIPIMIDTREQKAFEFTDSRVNKLHVGDYTAVGDFFTNTFIERKSEGDFVGTLGQAGFDRFCREIESAQIHGAYIFVVVENSIDKIVKNSIFKKHRSAMSLVWHNMRKIQHKYPRTVQFVFAPSRNSAQNLTQSLLFHGKEAWNVDIQYFLDKQNVVQRSL